MIHDCFRIPTRVNTGPWLTTYTLNRLLDRMGNERIALPICSLGTPVEELEELAPLVLPPLYHEALAEDLEAALLERIEQCFPFYQASQAASESPLELNVVRLPRRTPPALDSPKVLAFSVDTAVEEHGPHLPLATDTIQSYAVLDRLAESIDGFVVGPPVDYGHLTWGLPFGMSIDITPPLLSQYVTGFANAVGEWLSPDAMYVVDVHGSPVHRAAIEEGLKNSRCDRWAFRWLHEPLVPFAGDRGDQHAGGVETSLIEHIGKDLVDNRWWPDRADELTRKQMDLKTAVELTPDLPHFIDYVESHDMNGIVGDIQNYFAVDAQAMMDLMLSRAREDVAELCGSI